MTVPRIRATRPLKLTPTLKATRAPLHAALLDQVAAHPKAVPCLVQPEGLDWLDPRHEQQAAAADLCTDCPALRACRAYITGHPREPGVWAGTTEQDREQRSEAWRAGQRTRRAS